MKTCIDCAQTLPIDSFYTTHRGGTMPRCKTCHNKRRYEQRKTHGTCIKCARPTVENTKYCEHHLSYLREYNKGRVAKGIAQKHRDSLRDRVYDHYGRKCVCCGETHWSVLQLDHVNGGGEEHRKSIGTASHALYRWIIRNNFPDDIQVLCANCNFSKYRNGGTCFHKEKSV